MKKGTLGYLQQLKKKYMIGIFIAIVFLFIQFFLKNYTEEWISRYLTIGMGIAIIPIGLYLAKLLTIWPYKQEDFITKANNDNHSLYDNALMDLIIVNGKQSYYVNIFFYADHCLWLYTKDKRLTSNIIKEIFDRKAMDIEVSFIEDQDMFFNKINKATQIPESIDKILFQISI